jgi:hypothetical protein
MPLQPAPFSPGQVALREKLVARLELRRRFSDLRLAASKLLTEAETVALGLSDIEVQQVRAAGKLCGANFYSIAGQADAQDFKRLREDLEHVARSVDPLIEAIGEEARTNTPGADRNDFKERFDKVIESAITGFATSVLDDCANAAQEEIDSPDTAAEMAREFQRAE